MIDDYRDEIYGHVGELSSEEKKCRGVTYTPLHIVEYINSAIVGEFNGDWKDFKVLDLSCGTGVFLIDMLERLRSKTKLDYKTLIERNIYGLDIDQEAIRQAKSIFKKIAGEPVKCNLHCGNSLDKNFVHKHLGDQKFQAVVGNPPYVKIQNMSDTEKELLGQFELLSGNTDLYLAFYELGIERIDEEGFLGYVSSNTFLKNNSGKRLCQHMLDSGLLHELIDFKQTQVFDNLSTYACICLLSRQNSRYTYREPKSHDKKFHRVDVDSMHTCKKKHSVSVENIAIHNSDVKIIDKLENSGPSLLDLFHIRVGLATLADKVFMPGPSVGEDGSLLIFDDGVKIEKSILQRCVKASKIKTEKDLIDSKSYIIFPYKRINNSMSVMSEEELLNEYPNAHEYLSKHRDVLDRRDKGKKRNYQWYEYGRTQGLNTLWGEKLILSPLSLQPAFVHCRIEHMLYLSGYALFPKDDHNILLCQKVLESQMMKLYVDKRSKKMRSGWNVYSKEFIKNFSIPVDKLDDSMLSMEQDKFEKQLKELYGV